MTSYAVYEVAEGARICPRTNSGEEEPGSGRLLLGLVLRLSAEGFVLFLLGPRSDFEHDFGWGPPVANSWYPQTEDRTFGFAYEDSDLPGFPKTLHELGTLAAVWAHE